MNIVAAPLARRASGRLERRARRKPVAAGGRSGFLASRSRRLRSLLMCSLFSPMQDFADHEAALATAQAALDRLLAPPADDRAGAENPAPQPGPPRLFPAALVARPGRRHERAPSASLLLCAQDCARARSPMSRSSRRASMPSPIFVGRSPAEAATWRGGCSRLCPAAQSLAAVTARRGGAWRRASSRTAPEAGADAAVRTPWRNAARQPAGLAGRRSRRRRRCGAPARRAELLRAAPRRGRGADWQRLCETRRAAYGLEAARKASLFGRQLAEARRTRPIGICRSHPDFLGAADDAAVCEAMTATGVLRARRRLPGRCAETGAAARARWRRTADWPPGLPRPCARSTWRRRWTTIGRLARGGAASPDGVRLAASSDSGQGFAAVDSARGRLYHGVRLDAAGRIADYRIVAPTEWNFHPAGPFVRLCSALRIGARRGGAADRSACRSSSTPASPFRVEVREAAPCMRCR